MTHLQRRSLTSLTVVVSVTAHLLFLPGFHLTAEEPTTVSKAPHSTTPSPLLEKFRRRYRLAGLVKDPNTAQQRYRELSETISSILSQQPRTERLEWLTLLENASWSGGLRAAALNTLKSRYALIEADTQKDALAYHACQDAALYAARMRYEAAEYLYSIALSRATQPSLRFDAVMGTGELFVTQQKYSEAGTYYLQVVQREGSRDRDIVRQSHLRAARAFYSAGNISRALELLTEIELSYPESPEAEDARHLRKVWCPQPAE